MKRFLLLLTTMFVGLAGMAQTKQLVYSTMDEMKIVACQGSSFEYELVSPEGTTGVTLPDDIRYTGDDQDFVISYKSGIISGYATNAGVYDCVFSTNGIDGESLTVSVSEVHGFYLSIAGNGAIGQINEPITVFGNINPDTYESNYTYYWTSDEFATVGNITGRYGPIEFSTIGEHIISGIATNTDGCSVTSDIAVTIYRHKCNVLSNVYYNYEDLIVAEGETATTTIEFNSSFSDCYNVAEKREFFVQKAGDTTVLSNVDISGKFVTLTFPELSAGSYTYGLRISGASLNLGGGESFSANLTVESTECMDLHIGDEETGLSRKKDDLLNVRCSVGNLDFYDEAVKANYSFEWFSDESITWDSYTQGSNYDFDAYLVGSQLGTHTVFCRVTDNVKECSSTKSIKISIYRDDVQSMGAYVNYDDIVVNQGESKTGTFEFSQSMSEIFGSYSEFSYTFFVAKDGDESTFLIEQDVTNELKASSSKEFEFTLETSDLAPGEYKYGIYNPFWEEVSFAGKLTVVAPCKVEYKSPVVTFVSEPAEITVLGMQENMIIEIDGATAVEVPAAEMIDGKTVARFSITVDEIGQNSHSITWKTTDLACYDWASIVIITKDKIKETPVLKQNTVNICLEGVLEDDIIDLNSYVQETANEDIHLRWYNSQGLGEYLEGAEISKNQIGSVTYWAQYVANNNALMLPSDSVSLAFHFVSPYEMYVMLDQIPEDVYVSEPIEVTARTSNGYLEDCTTEWICAEAEITTVEKADLEAGVEVKQLTFNSAGQYKLNVKTSLATTDCFAQDSVIINVLEKTKLEAPITEDVKETYTLAEVAEINSSADFKFSDLIGNGNDEGTSEIKWFIGEENKYISIEAPQSLPTTAGTYTYYVACIPTASAVKYTSSDTVSFSFAIKNVYSVAEKTMVCPEANATIEISALAAINTESVSVIDGDKQTYSVVVDATDKNKATVTVGAGVYNVLEGDEIVAEFAVEEHQMYVEIDVESEEITLPNKAVITAYTLPDVILTWSGKDVTFEEVKEQLEQEPALEDSYREKKSATFTEAGSYVITIVGENKETGCSAKSEVEITVNAQPKMLAPQTEEKTICKTTLTENGLSFGEFVTNLNDSGSLKWYDESGAVLTNVPVLTQTSEAKAYTYYVSCVSDDNSALESEKAAVKVTIIDNEIPIVENTDQRICSFSEIKEFVAKSENVIWMRFNNEWALDYTDTTLILARGSKFMPSDSTIDSYAIVNANAFAYHEECVFDYQTATFQIIKPTVYIEFSEEEVTLPNVLTAEAFGSEVNMTYEWSCEDADIKNISDASESEEGDVKDKESDRVEVSFKKSGEYTVKCVVSFEGCTTTETRTIIVHAQPKLEKPIVTDSLITVCKNTITENGYSLYDYVDPSSISNLQWTLSNSDKVYAEAPVLADTIAAGTYTYILQNVALNESTLDSDPTRFTVKVVEVAAPEVAEEVIVCTPEESVVLTAKSENTVLWSTVYDYIETNDIADTAVYKRGATITSPYEVNGVDQTTWNVWATDGTCYSDPKVVKVSLSDMYVEISVDEEVTLPDSLLATAYAPEGSTFTWTCSNARISAAESEPAEIATESKFIAFGEAGSYTLVVLAENIETGCSAKEEIEITVNNKTVYTVSSEKLALTVGDSEELEVYADGELLSVNDVVWELTNVSPEGTIVASIEEGVITAENAGYADVVISVRDEVVATVPLTVTERSYYINPERPQIVVNQDTVTISLYNSKGQKIGFSSSFIEAKQDQGPSAVRFDMETDFDNDVVKVWAEGNVGGVGILTLAGTEGKYEFYEEFELDAIFNGNEYHIADMYLTLGSEGQKIQAYNQKGEAVDMPEYTVCDPFSGNCMEPETSDQYICQLLGDNCFNIENGMVVPTKCGYGRAAFYNSIGLVSFFQVFVVDKNNYSFSGVGDEKGIAVGTEGYLSLSKLVESGNSKELIDVTTAKYVSDNPNVLNIVQEDNSYKFVALAQGTATVSVYDGEELVASQLVTVLGETVRIEKVVLLSQGEITIQDIFGNDVPADAKWEVAPYVGESSAITLSGNTIKLNDAGVIVIKGENMEATLYISQQEDYMVMAGAHLSDGTAIASNNITLHYGMPSSYGASEQAYLYAYQLPTAAGAEFADIVSEEVTWKASAENVVDLKRTSIGEAYIFPLDTTATVIMTAYYQEKEIGSVTVNVKGKEKEKDYSIAFSEDVYKVKVNEATSVCYTLGSSFDATTSPIVYASDNSIVQVETAVSTTMNCFTIKGLQAGEATLVAKVATTDTTYLAEVAVVVLPEDMKPQLPKPGYNTNEFSVCYTKPSSNAVAPAISLENMVFPTSDFGKVQWYDNAGNQLANVPYVNTYAVGTTTYYVSQVASDTTVEYLESEKVPFTVTVSYVPEPTLNMYDQKICDGSQAQAFEAKTQEGNIIKWLQNGQTIQEGNTLMPTSTDVFEVIAYNEKSGCTSVPVMVTNTIGHPIDLEITVANQTFAPGEQIAMTASVADTNSYSIVWKAGESIIQGTEATLSFNAVGSHTIACQAIEKATGCLSEQTTAITVEKKVVLVDSIVVEPKQIELYVDDKTNYSVSVYPSFATNKKYTGYIDNPEVAIVRGSVIYGLSEGETFLQLTSKDKNATVVVPITVATKYVPVQAISLPNIITMAIGDTKALEATVKPDDATNKNVEFSIVGENIISLTDNILTAVGEGTATLVAKVDNVFSSTVVYVTSNQESITDIIVPDEVVLKEGASKAITCKVAPVTLAANDLNWEIADESIASLDKDVVVAKAIGTTELKISSGNITKIVSVIVNKSDAPQIKFPESFSMPNAQDAALKSLAPGYTIIPIDDYVSDDNTSFGEMSITVVTDQEAVTASIDDNGKILVNAGDFIGTVKITVTVTDVDGLVSSGSFYLVVENVKNQAPEIIADTIQLKYDEDVYVNFADIAKDDYTAVEDLLFAFSVSEEYTVEYEVVDQQLRLSAITDILSPDLGFLNVTVADIYGEETTGKIALVMNSLPNKAPVIAEIADQIENDTMSFTSLDLRQYVKDDFTSASAIVWSAESSANLAVTITDGVAVPTVLNKFWNGVEAITFVAKDEEGLTSSVVVYYKRKVSQESYDNQVDKKDDIFASKWDGAPTVTISTMRQIGVPGDVFVLMANISSFDCTWQWDIEGAQGIDQTSMLQMISFDKPGVYPVALTVTSADEKYSITANLAINLTVVGIQDRDLFICQGQAAQLNATDGVNSYYWSTGEVAQTVSVRPEKTTKYAVTMKKGMFTLTDSVTVHVSVPVALMEDSVMCAGTTFELEAQGEYNSYSWNTGADTKSIMIPAEVATYSVFAVDSMQCASVDTFNLTKVNELPKINLGDDQTPCDGTTVTLNAGEGYTYLWSNGATTQTIDLVDSTRTIWAQITDENLCVNSDTVTVAFTYPFPEQIGVATFSETTDHIIIAWEKTKDVNTVSYRVERETDMTDNWEQVGDDVMFDESGIVVDEDVNYKQRAYKYRLVTVDGCKNEAISEVHRSMISTITYQTNGLQTINWCAYEPMENVTQYLVLRGTDATAMDTVDKVPASNLYEIWNETDPKYKGDENIKYRVVFRLKSEINENAYNTLDGQPVAGAYTKAESGPFSLALSNIAEVENDVAVKDITFPADVVVYPTTINTVINVAIASHNENNYLVEVLNANGQLVAQAEAENVANAIISLPAAHLSQGLYSVRVSTNGNVKTIKVVK